MDAESVSSPQSISSSNKRARDFKSSSRAEVARLSKAYACPSSPIYANAKGRSSCLLFTSRCIPCRDRKIKCSRTQPCRYCTKKQLPCAFSEVGKRKLYPVEYVEQLEEKLASQGRSCAPQGLAQRTAHVSQPSAGIVDPEGDHVIVGRTTPRPTPDDSEGQSPAPPHVPSSSLSFGHQIKSLGAAISPAASHPHQGSIQNMSVVPDDTYGLLQQIDHSNWSQPNLPSFEEAYDLLETVLNSLEKLQHLFEPRSFCDRLSAAYDELGEPILDVNDLWYVQFLMAIALGKLLRGKQDLEGMLPGTDFYLEADKRLPGPAILRRQGALAIEILGMMAFFLQCADLRHDAYIYVSPLM